MERGDDGKRFRPSGCVQGWHHLLHRKGSSGGAGGGLERPVFWLLLGKFRPLWKKRFGGNLHELEGTGRR